MQKLIENALNNIDESTVQEAERNSRSTCIEMLDVAWPTGPVPC